MHVNAIFHKYVNLYGPLNLCSKKLHLYLRHECVKMHGGKCTPCIYRRRMQARGFKMQDTEWKFLSQTERRLQNSSKLFFSIYIKFCNTICYITLFITYSIKILKHNFEFRFYYVQMSYRNESLFYAPTGINKDTTHTEIIRNWTVTAKLPKSHF